jgi:nucleotide-binding universal stress UspA family protein
MHILLATDGSEAARFAQAHLLALRWSVPIHLTVMTVLDAPHPPFTSLTSEAREAYTSAVDALHWEAERKAADIVRETRHALEPHVGSMITRIHEGPPGQVIVNMAHACRADLVAVGSRGLGMVSGFLLGSVSHYVVRHAPCSVLVAKRPPMRDYRILLAMDGSAHSDAALQWLGAIALSPAETRIHVVVVAERPKAASIAEVVEGEPAPKEADWGGAETSGSAAEEAVAEAERHLRAQGARVTGAVYYGHATSELVTAVHEFEPQLFVLGAKGHHSPPDTQLGHVARTMMDHVPCSTVIVRP